MSENSKVVCSFCGKDKQDTNILIAGTTAHICDACIKQAHEIIKEDLKDEIFSRENFNLLKPKATENILLKEQMNLAQHEISHPLATFLQI